MSETPRALALMCPVADCTWGKNGSRYVGATSLALAGHVQKRHPEELRPTPVAPRYTMEERKPTRAAIYLRVSTVDQHPENQLPNIKAFCGLAGYEITQVYEDKASGKDMNRPALQQLLIDSAQHPPPFDVVVFRRLSRLGRSLKDNIALFDHFEKLGIVVRSSEESYNTSTASGRFQRNVLASVAEYFRENLLEEIQEGIARRRAEGKYLGRHPAGCGIPTELGGLGPCPDGANHKGFDVSALGALAEKRKKDRERQRRSRARLGKHGKGGKLRGPPRDTVPPKQTHPSPGDTRTEQEA